MRGPKGAPPKLVFLPGVCSNANAYLQSFPEAARAHGGIVAIDGDKDCAGVPDFHTFSRDIDKQHRRIEAALVAAGVTEIGAEGLTLVGYSQGATIAEELTSRWPERYTRIILIGSPKDPSAQRVKSARAVVTMSCSLDIPQRMKGGAINIDKAGVPATYLEMPGCTHGNMADAERVFDEAFRWLFEHQRPPTKPTNPVPLVGVIEDAR